MNLRSLRKSLVSSLLAILLVAPFVIAGQVWIDGKEYTTGDVTEFPVMGSDPGPPSYGYLRLYSKFNGIIEKLYWLDSDSNVYEIGTGGGGTPGGTALAIQYNNSGSFGGVNIGSPNQYLKVNGAGTGYEYGIPGGSGNVTAEGFNIDQVLYGFSTTGIKSDAQFTYNATNDILGVPTLTLSGTGTINGLDAIDATGEATLEATLDIAGDVSSTGMGATVIGADTVRDSMIDWGTSANQVNPTVFVNQDIGDITITTGSWAVEDDSHLHGDTTIVDNITLTSITQITGRSHTSLTDIGTNTHTVIDTFIASKAQASGLASLDTSTLVVQNPANAISTPTASKIPIADTSAKLDGWITLGSTITDGEIVSTEDVMKTQIHFDIDGGGSVITTGAKAWVRVPFNMTITGWDIVANESCSIVVDIYKSAYASAPPTTGSIAGTEKPTLSSAQRSQDTSLTSWTISVSAGDYVRVNVDSVTTATKITIDIYGNKS